MATGWQWPGRGWRSASSAGGMALGPGPLLPSQPRPARGGDSGWGQPAGSPQPLHQGLSSSAGAEGSAIHRRQSPEGHTLGTRAGPGPSPRPPRPPAWTHTGGDVFAEGIYCSGTEVAHRYLTGVHCVGLVRFRDVRVCPKDRRGRLTRYCFRCPLSPEPPTHAARPLPLRGFLFSYVWKSQPVAGGRVTGGRVCPRRGGRRGGRGGGRCTESRVDCHSKGMQSEPALPARGCAGLAPQPAPERPGRTHRQNQEQKLGAGRRSLHRGHAAEDPADFPPSSVMFCFFF